MKTTIDRAGRVVIPKRIRQATGIVPGSAVEIEVREGEVVVRPPTIGVRLEKRGRLTVLVPEAEVPPLTKEMVENMIRDLRERRLEEEEEI